MIKKLLLTSLIVIGGTHTAHAYLAVPCDGAGNDDRSCICDTGSCMADKCRWDDALSTFICNQSDDTAYGQAICFCNDPVLSQSIQFDLGCYEDTDCPQDMGGADGQYGCSYNRCILCQECTTDCADKGTWRNAGTGYQSKAIYECGCNGTCEQTDTQYRCAAGYYGSSTNGKTGCTQCPSSGGIAGSSIAGDNAAITKCFIPSGTSFSDSTGSGIYTDNCYYSN